MIVKLPVVWEMMGFVEVEAASVEEAVIAFNEDAHGLPEDASYVEGSFRLCHEEISIYN